MQRWSAYATEAFDDVTVWNVDYPTDVSFVAAAGALVDGFYTMRQYGYRFEDVYFIGYSMGGLVARQMVAMGFPVTSLITVCSPHHGVNRYIFTRGNEGVRSLQKNSPEILSLNNSDRDMQMRSRYLFCSVAHTFKLPLLPRSQPEDTDTVVSGNSARGVKLGVKGMSVLLHMNNVMDEFRGNPHLEGMNPLYFKHAINRSIEK